MDWRAIGNVVGQTLTYGAAAGFASLAAHPTAPWQLHAAAAGSVATAYLLGKFQQSPLPPGAR